MSRRRSYRRSTNLRRGQERSFEAATYGLIVILFLIAALYPNIRSDFVALAGGAILVGSAIFQGQRRWRVNLLTWLGGLFLLFVGFLSFSGTTGRMPGGMLLPIGVMAVVIVVSFLSGNL
jgi:hypothetical protein